MRVCYVCFIVSCQVEYVYHIQTDELAMWMSNGDVASWQTSDLGLFWHDSCRYELTKFDQGLAYVARCTGLHNQLSCQQAGCITNTTYTLATNWRRWYQPALSPVDTQARDVRVRGVNWPPKIWNWGQKMIPRLCRTGDFWPWPPVEKWFPRACRHQHACVCVGQSVIQLAQFDISEPRLSWQKTK